MELVWRPGPWVGWKHSITAPLGAIPSFLPGRIQLWGTGASGRAQTTGYAFADRMRRLAVQGFCPEGVVLGPKRPSLTALNFHLVNFPDYVGEWIGTSEAAWAGRTGFRAAGWDIQLDLVENYKELKEGLKVDQGYAITHVGRANRLDGGAFDAREARQLLANLHLLFGFVRGSWSGPALFVGRDPSGTPIWRDLSVLDASPHVYRQSFFVNHDPKMIGRIAPGFFDRLMSSDWEDPFRRAVQFYVNANLSVPIEVGIILAHSGLELLAWSTFVRGGLVAPQEFDRTWPAERQIRRLMALASVPVAVPPELSALSSALAPMKPGADAATAIASVRNRIVHPPKNRAFLSPDSDLIRDTWRLSLLYLELSLLYLTGYRGEMLSRVVGKAVPVPW